MPSVSASSAPLPSKSSEHVETRLPVVTRNWLERPPTCTVATLKPAVPSGACWRTQTYWPFCAAVLSALNGATPQLQFAPDDRQNCACAPPLIETGTSPDSPDSCTGSE